MKFGTIAMKFGTIYLFNKWRRINENWHILELLTFTVDSRLSSKRSDFAPLAQQCPGERHVRLDQFFGLETI